MSGGIKIQFALFVGFVLSLLLPLHSFAGNVVPSFDSFNGITMVGYQAWFTTPGDGSGRGWKHWGKSGKFDDNNCTIDFWPDVSEYEVTYETGFDWPDGTPARVFSSHDYSTIDLHFKWMEEYNIDGAFLQRFVHNLDNNDIKNHYMVTVDHGLKAAAKYGRAVSIRYDISGIDNQGAELLLDDFADLREKYGEFNREDNPTFLYHKGKPLIAVGGIGFADNGYSNDIGYLKEGEVIVDELIKLGYSILIRVPNKWRQQTGGQALPISDTAKFFEIIRKCDIIMPWHVGAYTEESYDHNDWAGVIEGDIQWACDNGMEYVPVVYPGFSWTNLKGPNEAFKPRNRGSFFWKQVFGALNAGADKIFLAQFDEVDEGTQYFKSTVGDNVPVSNNSVFQSYEDSTDQYLVLAGQATSMVRTTFPSCGITNLETGELFSKDVKIFPNPSHGIFNIEMPGNFTGINYNVFNVQKNIIKKGSAGSGLVNLDMNNMEKGVYIIQINGENQVKSHQLILK